MGKYITVIFMFSIGYYLFFQAYKDVDRFFEYRKIKKMAAMMGRKGARIIYMLTGIWLMIFSAWLYFI